jgi:hypothetical protein
MPPVDNPGGPALVNVAFYELDPETVGCLIPVVPEHHPQQHQDDHQQGPLRRAPKRPSGPSQGLKADQPNNLRINP